MSLYRVYIDEVGNHDLTHTEDPNQRFLSLTGIILESEYTLNTVQPEMNQIKQRYFQHDPDESIIFHRKEIINKRSPFHALRNPETEMAFNQDILSALERWDYKVITVVIDKKAHRERYQIWHYHPYHYCLKVLLERFILFLHYGGYRGDVMVEKRGGEEDKKLMDSYNRLYEHGTDDISKEVWQNRLTSNQLKLRDKQANITGLQLADLIAHPSRREILIENQLLEDKRDTFSDQICAILRKNKYRRNPYTGQISGYGTKLLP